MAKRSRMWEPNGFSVAAVCEQASRDYQEDGYSYEYKFNALLPDTMDKSVNRMYLAIFDGHGGDGCMKFCCTNMKLNLAQALPKASSVEDALKVAFAQTENDWFEIRRAEMADALKKEEANSSTLSSTDAEKLQRLKATVETSGCTASVCLIENDTVYCANVGDSRSVLYLKGNKCEELTDDHKPNRESEKNRIESAGAAVKQKTYTRPGYLCCKTKEIGIGPYRVFPGGLAIARSIGDAKCKMQELGAVPGTVIAEPEIMKSTITEDTQFLVLASDGLWDTFTKSAKHDNLINEYVPLPKDGNINYTLTKVVCGEIVATAVGSAKRPDDQDNTSAIVLSLPHHFGKKVCNLNEWLKNGKKKP